MNSTVTNVAKRLELGQTGVSLLMAGGSVRFVNAAGDLIPVETAAPLEGVQAATRQYVDNKTFEVANTASVLVILNTPFNPGAPVLADGGGASTVGVERNMVGVVVSANVVATAGRVTLVGQVWPEGALAGDLLYLSDTPGVLTKTQPAADAVPVIAATSNNSGYFVRPRAGTLVTDTTLIGAGTAASPLAVKAGGHNHLVTALTGWAEALDALAPKVHKHAFSDTQGYTVTQTNINEAVQLVLQNYEAWNAGGASGAGDMLKSVYDTNGDGVVDAAATAPWLGISGKPSTYTPSVHAHTDYAAHMNNMSGTAHGITITSLGGMPAVPAAVNGNVPVFQGGVLVDSGQAPGSGSADMTGYPAVATFTNTDIGHPLTVVGAPLMDANTRAVIHFDGSTENAVTESAGITAGTLTYGAGRFGQAAIFAGAASVAYAGGWALAADFTVECVIKPTLPTTDEAGFLGSFNFVADKRSWLLSVTTDGDLQAQFSTDGTLQSENTILAEGPAIFDGAFHHVVYTRSGTTTYLFIDGVLAGQATVSGSSYAEDVLCVGAAYPGTLYFTGSVDEVRISQACRLTESGDPLYASGGITSGFTPPAQPYIQLAVDVSPVELEFDGDGASVLTNAGTYVPRQVKVTALPNPVTAPAGTLYVRSGTGVFGEDELDCVAIPLGNMWISLGSGTISAAIVSVTWDSLGGKPATFAPAPHAHVVATTGAAGFMPALNGDAGTYLNGLGQWVTVSGGTASSMEWEDILNRPATFPPGAHNHLWAHLTDKPTTFPPEAHAHSVVTIGAAGYISTLPNDATKVFNGVGQWVSMASGGANLTILTALPAVGSRVDNTLYFITAGDDAGVFGWRDGSLFSVSGGGVGLGTTDSTAYRGDHGLIAYNHSQVTTGNPHGTTVADISGLGTTLGDLDGRLDTLETTPAAASVEPRDLLMAQHLY